jgi:GNAT superfamily N-acetyltransferase
MRVDTVLRIATAWCEIGEVSAGWAAGKITVEVSAGSRMAPPGWVGAVTLGSGSVAVGALVTAPDEPRAAAVRGEVSHLRPARITEPEYWAGLIPHDGRVLGPAELAYLDTTDFSPAAGDTVVEAALGDVKAAVANLETAAGEDDVNEVGITDAQAPLFIVWRDDVIASVCSYREWPGGLAHMMVMSHPDHRGHGLAKSAATAASEHALDAGLIPQWRARVPASQAVARSLGYTTLGTQLSVLLSGG